MKGLHKKLPNGLSRAYLATLIQYHDCLLANREEKTELIEQPLAEPFKLKTSANLAAPSHIDSIDPLTPSEQNF